TPIRRFWGLTPCTGRNTATMPVVIGLFALHRSKHVILCCDLCRGRSACSSSVVALLRVVHPLGRQIALPSRFKLASVVPLWGLGTDPHAVRNDVEGLQQVGELVLA